MLAERVYLKDCLTVLLYMDLPVLYLDRHKKKLKYLALNIKITCFDPKMNL